MNNSAAAFESFLQLCSNPKNGSLFNYIFYDEDFFVTVFSYDSHEIKINGVYARGGALFFVCFRMTKIGLKQQN